MAAVAAGAAVAGAGLSVYSTLKSAKDQEELYQEQARNYETQAAEFQYRAEVNRAIQKEYTEQAKLKVGAEAGGRLGTNIAAQMDIQNRADLQDRIFMEEVNSQIRAIKSRGATALRMADMTTEAAKWKAVGTVVGLGSTLATSRALHPNTGSPGSLPE